MTLSGAHEKKASSSSISKKMNKHTLDVVNIEFDLTLTGFLYFFVGFLITTN